MAERYGCEARHQGFESWLFCVGLGKSLNIWVQLLCLWNGYAKFYSAGILWNCQIGPRAL